MSALRKAFTFVLSVLVLLGVTGFTFVFLMGSYPSPGLESFSGEMNGSDAVLEASVSNSGPDGEVTVKFYSEGSVVGDETVYLGSGESTVVEKVVRPPFGESFSASAYASEKPELLRSERRGEIDFTG